ncbi:hypothetical protein ACIQBJ_15185 [Kitasatospora sp. NPDC088391]|uniref:hypothetical protein n=1 Tax=Kitasatospora sp. NPDC088391 TaxID=3364074 RepID=UPI0037FCD3DC
MTRRERFRLYAAEHFTAPDESVAALSRCRGTVERQTSRSRLASLARISPQGEGPAPRRVQVVGRSVLIPAQRTCSARPVGTEG